MRYGRVFFGIVLALVVVGVVAGVAWTAYNAGIYQGVAESGKLIPPTIDGNTAPVAPFFGPYGFYGPLGFRRGFGFGFGIVGCLVPLFFIILLFALFRLAFRPRWGRGWGGPWMRGGWDGSWDPSKGNIPPAVQEWHRRLHETENQPPTQPA